VAHRARGKCIDIAKKFARVFTRQASRLVRAARRLRQCRNLRCGR
jgi:hypothetical protein